MSEAVDTRWPVEMRVCVVESCELTDRRVWSAVMAVEFVSRLDIANVPLCTRYIFTRGHTGLSPVRRGGIMPLD
ncbi:hypothetical protein BDS110ZK25_22540 [Bradyrhizobium diazoefficiens]|uniref:Uncharacterized protein n=1 Tax=Bradyrhizobium diazoefficiens TaxID=1355477 RepID=A0A810CD11_9BRAD|nr:hypothetical protein F07S3_74900 [Bradyrhizobium diazoefficiens]BCA15341.1 hypothetical protein BDHF08_71880 [Bradyrhizobium diazoefficiens]BCE33441.1 hypothetical protein XF2B_72100 [Bradyrhizobium diazoefficiens]BCE42219.1 hypothetical protein XF3B_72500 [Bradyrhizobium diazoefficiens]BCE59753.1 hypothetical protein XF5B_72650 [Bradyrhizobium diazoefficiens]